jgi:prefoldin subunit 5
VKVACEFFIEAEGDASLVSVETGIPGLYIDLTADEGLEYIQKRSALLSSNLSRCCKIIDEIEGHISTITRTLPQELDIQEPFT